MIDLSPEVLRQIADTLDALAENEAVTGVSIAGDVGRSEMTVNGSDVVYFRRLPPVLGEREGGTYVLQMTEG